jgi:putative oxidoreductase
MSSPWCFHLIVSDFRTAVCPPSWPRSAKPNKARQPDFNSSGARESAHRLSDFVFIFRSPSIIERCVPEKKESVAGKKRPVVLKKHPVAAKRQPRAAEKFPATRRKRKADTVVWVVSAVAAAIFFGAGASKLGGGAQAVESFTRFGYPDSFRVIVALLEFAGAVALLVPRAAFYGAVGLGLLMIGAIYSHMSIEEWPQAIAPLILLLALAWVAVARRETKTREGSRR